MEEHVKGGQRVHLMSLAPSLLMRISRMEVLQLQETSVAILNLVSMKVSGAIQLIHVSDGNFATFPCVQVISGCPLSLLKPRAGIVLHKLPLMPPCISV